MKRFKLAGEKSLADSLATCLPIKQYVGFATLNSLRRDLGNILVVELKPLLILTIQRIAGIVSSTSRAVVTYY